MKLKGNPSNAISFRDVYLSDVPVFFEQQLEGLAGATTADWAVYQNRWNRLLSLEVVQAKTVLWAGEVAGYVFALDSKQGAEIDFGFGHRFYEEVAARALELFLANISRRPRLARARKSDPLSGGVLETCGFRTEDWEVPDLNAEGETIANIVFRKDQA